MSKQSSEAIQILKDERQRQKDAKAARKAKRAANPINIKNVCKVWLTRLFHTAFMIMIGYLVIMVCTVLIPAAMGYVIGSMGYTLENNVELLLSLFAGLFFTAWVFALSFFALRFAWKKYIVNIKNTLPNKIASKLDDLQ